MTLTASAIVLLLELLEGAEPVIVGRAAWIYQDQVNVLRQDNLLQRDGSECVAMIPMLDGDELVAVFPSSPGGPLVAFDPDTGLVPIDDEQIHRWRVNVLTLMRELTVGLDLGSEIRPMELVPGLLWEIGLVRLGRRPVRQPLWFARRLGISDVRVKVMRAINARPHISHRILLTSTAREWLGEVLFAGSTVMSVNDVFDQPNALAVSPDVIAGRISGIEPKAGTGPVELSEDGRLLVLNGASITLRSQLHRDAVSRLVAAYRAGRRLHVSKIIGPDSAARSLDQFFGRALFKQIEPYLGRSSGHWWLEPTA